VDAAREVLKALYGAEAVLDIREVVDLQAGESGKFLTARRGFPLDQTTLDPWKRTV
jgi:hypothetical protein